MQSTIFDSDTFIEVATVDVTYAIDIKIISAFVTSPGVKWISHNKQINTPVVIVGRFSPMDLLSGASSFDAIQYALDNGYQVKALSNLHAKIYLFDNKKLYIGSANLTGKGLSLIQDGNLEVITTAEATEQNLLLVDKIICSALEVDYAVINKMKIFIENLSADKMQSIEVWPEVIFPTTSSLFVSDFPMGRPGEIIDIYKINSSLDFARIENESNFDVAQTNFKNSKAFLWLENIIKENIGNRDLGFGQVSRLLHDELADDPSPYRQEIKSLQANLYAYTKYYASDVIEIYMPGRRTEVLRLIKG